MCIYLSLLDVTWSQLLFDIQNIKYNMTYMSKNVIVFWILIETGDRGRKSVFLELWVWTVGFSDSGHRQRNVRDVHHCVSRSTGMHAAMLQCHQWTQPGASVQGREGSVRGKMGPLTQTLKRYHHPQNHRHHTSVWSPYLKQMVLCICCCPTLMFRASKHLYIYIFFFFRKEELKYSNDGQLYSYWSKDIWPHSRT